MPEHFSPIDSSQIDKSFKPEAKQIKEKTLESILDTPLTVDNINTYASDAVNKLIDFSYKKVSEYKKNNQTEGLSHRQIEDDTFKHCGLTSISCILDNINKKAEEIRDINKIISSPMQINKIITPPDVSSFNLTNGESDNKFKEKQIIDRTKTILFVLKEDFDIDIHNQSELSITKGIISNEMMRKTSYFLIDVPKLDRSILVCDEEGNASYVFNSSNLKALNISQEQIINSTKSELNTLIEENNKLGKRVVYSENKFVSKIRDAIENPDINQKIKTLKLKPESSDNDEIKSDSYLYPKASDGELSCSRLAKNLGTNGITLSKIINLIGQEKLGTFTKKKFGSVITDAISPDQQQIIIKEGSKFGLFDQLADEDELSCNGLSEKLGIDNKTVLNIIKKIGPEKLGPVKIKKFVASNSIAYNPEQQQLITNEATKRGLFLENASENELSYIGLAEKLGIDNSVIEKIIRTIDPEKFGLVVKKKFNTRVSIAYNPEQQQLITNEATKRGLFLENASENELSCASFSKKMNISNSTLAEIINRIDPIMLGNVVKKKFNGNVASAYNLEQQQLIINEATVKGFLFEQASEDELSAAGLSKKLGVDRETLVKIIDQIDSDELGYVNKKRFRTLNTFAYNIDQQKIIEQYLLKKRNNK